MSYLTDNTNKKRKIFLGKIFTNIFFGGGGGCWGMRIPMSDEVFMKVNLEKHRSVIFGKYTLNPYLG